MSLIAWHGENAPVGVVSKTPSEISGLRAHWDAALGVSVDGSDQITSWTDQSGNGYTLTSVSGNEPEYDSANDRIYFRGDTRVEYLENQSWSFDITTCTVVCVWDAITTSSNRSVWGGMIGASNIYHRTYLDSSNGLRVQWSNSTVTATRVHAMTSNSDLAVFAYRFNEASSQKIRTNQTTDASTTINFSTVSNNCTEIYLGVTPSNISRAFVSGYEAEAYMYECAIYDEFISDSDMDALMNHLVSKHSI